MARNKRQKAKKQVIVWVTANIGGIGKTTLSAHLAYKFAKLGFNTLLIDLDTNGSLARFCGLEVDSDPMKTSAALFDKDFSGDYPFQTPEWGRPNGEFQVCLGGDVMLSVSLDLANRTGKEYILQRVLKKYPLEHDLIVLDSTASMDILAFSALALASHIIIPLPMSVKMTGVNSLLQWARAESENLDLDPAPTILGAVPMRVEKSADQTGFSLEIQDVLKQQNVHCFPKVRFSREFENASNRGIAPLYVYRPNNSACKDFDPMITAIKNELL
jgi:chromosome partitioning protein